jgi:aspartyl protease family protein
LERQPQKGGPSNARLRLLLVAGVVGGVLVAAASLSPAGLTGWDVANAAPLAIILLLMVARLSVSTRPLGPMARQLAVFLSFGVVLIVGYSYRDDFGHLFDRALGTIVPGRGAETARGVMQFQADDSGQFVIDAEVNGVAVHFLVDTGASGIALTQRDASRLGMHLEDLQFTGLFATANGTERAAPVTLGSVRIGPMSARAVAAWVNEGDLDQSLLGMSFLSTLGRVEIHGHTLVLQSGSDQQ